MTDSPRCLVLGDALLDVVVHPTRPPTPGGDVPASIEARPGGQGANVAVRLARRGMAVSLACALGSDPAGSQVRAALEGDGVILRPVIQGATGAVVVLVDPGGERMMFSHRIPFALAAAGASLPDADWTVVSGYLLAEPDAPSLGAALAVRRGERAVLGCAIAADMAGAWEAAARGCRPGLVILNAAEAATLLGSGGDAAALARDLAVRLGSRVVVTVPDGAATAGPDGAHGAVSAARAGAPASDTTGAGDALAAGMVAALAAGGTLEDALAAGVSLGDLVARVPGAQGRVAGERTATLPS